MAQETAEVEVLTGYMPRQLDEAELAQAVDATITAARDVMEGAADPVVDLDVTLTVDAGQGQNWAEAH